MIFVDCVYGPEHVPHIRDVLVPSLLTASKSDITLRCLPYRRDETTRVGNFQNKSVTVEDIDNTTGRGLGFAEAHNILASSLAGSEFFVIINPDCIATQDCIDALVERFTSASENRVGIVEGRQWPYEHPKEYDPITLRTPWASGAFCLVNAKAYAEVGGMDEAYFMYLEDVDLSWSMTMAGYAVLYEPSSCIVHFSGGPYYRNDLVENEKYYSVRNFILIARKFFGKEGEETAWNHVDRFADKDMSDMARTDILENFGSFPTGPVPGIRGKNSIKILGFCRFHEFAK